MNKIKTNKQTIKRTKCKKRKWNYFVRHFHIHVIIIAIFGRRSLKVEGQRDPKSNINFDELGAEKWFKIMTLLLP